MTPPEERDPTAPPKGARYALTGGIRERIRSARQTAGMTRTELAEAARVTEKTIYNLENESSGRATFNEYTLEVVARALGVAVADLIGGAATQPEEPVYTEGRVDDHVLLRFYSAASPLIMPMGKEEHALPVEMVVPPRAEKLADEPVFFRITTEAFRPPESIDPYVRAVREELLKELDTNSRLYDGRVASLRKLVKTDEGWIADLCPASYFDALATNFRGMDLQPDGEPCTLRELLHGRTKALEPFHESPLVNHLGIVCLIETADRKLIIQERSDAVANRGLTLSASVTGAIDFQDVEHARQLQGGNLLSLSALARVALAREAVGELGIEIEQIRFLGLIREFERGGKPELYFYARSSLSLASTVGSARLKASERFETTGLLGIPFGNESAGGEFRGTQSLEQRFRALQDLAWNRGNTTLRCGIGLLCLSFTDP